MLISQKPAKVVFKKNTILLSVTLNSRESERKRVQETTEERE